jgi:hypothetical protein
MMDLPLAMMTPTSAPLGGGTATGGRGEDPEGFAATLTSMLGDAGREVVEMVEALETLAALDGADREQLATVGWPLPAFLALSEVAGEPLPDEVPPAVDALLDQLAEIAAGVAEGATEGASAAEDAVTGALPSDADVDETVIEDAPVDDPSVAAAAARAGTPAAGQRPEQPGAQRETSDSTSRNVEAAADDVEAARNRGQEVAAAARTRGAERAAHRAAEGAAPDPGRGPGAIPATATADAAGAELTVDTAANLTGPPLARGVGENRPVGLPSAIQRILDAVERLENMPPPRQLTLELGDIRLRVGMEDGQVRLTLLDGDSDAGDDLLRDAQQELAQRGFDLGDGERPGSDGDGGGEQAAPFGRRVAASTPNRVRTEPAGSLRL